jgi:hypothetical protein
MPRDYSELVLIIFSAYKKKGCELLNNEKTIGDLPYARTAYFTYANACCKRVEYAWRRSAGSQ